MPVDVLAFGPHPDDAEIGCGAMLRKLKDLGYTTGIVDMTTGDMGWGTPEIRADESRRAAEILKLDVRENLDMGDCRVEDTFDNRLKVVEVLRRHRPQMIFAPYYNLPIGRGLGHNDHYKTGQIVSNAYNLSHLAKAPAAGAPHQAKAIYYYFLPPGAAATFVVDVTSYVDDWLAALDCHVSQFHNSERPRPSHLPQVRDVFLTYASYWGWQIGTRYGQAFLATGPLKIGDPMSLVKDVIPRP